MTATRSILAAAAALTLAGCFSFGAKTPPTLMTLTPAHTRSAAGSRTASAAETVVVTLPTVPQELRAQRVPVRTGTTQVSYLKDAQWVDMPSALFSQMLTEAIASTGRVVLDARQATFEPGIVLTGDLQSFGIDADRMEVVAVYDAALAAGPDKVRTRRFEARVPIASIDAASAAPALNQAANQVAAEVATWIGGDQPPA
jgi:cholesterol transport system auxiliary component